jgi:uncharacterized protein YlzI (FlbEa/FlbD family)
MLVLFTLTDGQPIYVNPDHIITVSEPANMKGTTVITLVGAQSLAVKETIADIAKVIEIKHFNSIGPAYKVAKKKVAEPSVPKA